MKKIILILTILLLCGCSDYKELNDLRIVSTLIVDFKDNEYITNFELLNSDKKSENASSFVEGRGKTLEESMNDIFNQSAYFPYLSHMKVVILSESIAKDKLEKLYDFFARDPSIRKDFYVLMTDNTEEFIKFKSEEKLSIGELLKNIIENNKENNSRFRTSEFREILHAYLQKNNYFLGKVNILNYKIELDENYVVVNNKLSSKIDENAILFMNILDNYSASFMFADEHVFEIYDYKTDIEVSKNSIDIDFYGDVRLTNMSGAASSTSDDTEKLEKLLIKSLTNFFENCISYSKNINIDIYNFDYMYYRYYPKYADSNKWKELNYNISVDIAINEEGLILDSLGDEHNEK